MAGKPTKIFKKLLAICLGLVYNSPCCDMIAVKREVAVKPKIIRNDGFSAERMSVAGEMFTRKNIDDKSLYR